MSDDNTLDTTVEGWQAEMERYDKANVAGKTLAELAQELQISKTVMGIRLQALINEGRCTRAMGMRIDKRGRRLEVAVYQLIPQKKTRKQ